MAALGVLAVGGGNSANVGLATLGGWYRGSITLGGGGGGVRG